MKRSTIAFLASASVLLGFSAWRVAMASPTQEASQAVTAVGVLLPLAGGSGEAAPSFIGTNKCKKCHTAQYKSWKKTKMANAFEILRPGNSAEAKTEHGLDANKDFTTDKTCLACHTTGFGKPGGYAIPDPKDKKAVRKAKKLQGVGCESCHGPGGVYSKFHETIMKEKKDYTLDEMYADGMMTKIEAKTCTACHNDKSPTIEKGATFDFDAEKDKGAHEHKPLKNRK